MIVTERFTLNPLIVRNIQGRTEKFGYGLLGLATYYRTYSRIMQSGKQEHWADTVIRCVEGILSIRKWWYTIHFLPWDEGYWQGIGARMADAMFELRFLPAGRQIWTLGTDHLYTYGAMAANNCGAKYIQLLSRDMTWIMNALMLGVGTGATTYHANLALKHVDKEHPTTFVVPDDRAGWVDSLGLLFKSYEEGSQEVHFDYSLVRPAGAAIRGFGGTASGPEPLRAMHEKIRTFLEAFVNEDVSQTRLIADVTNVIGQMVVSGNVRRSAEIMLGSPEDTEFLDLKDYQKNPERVEWGWLSNNSAVLRKTDDFAHIPEVANRIVTRGEPGVINLLNVQKYGRYAEEMPDLAESTNPCAEIPLEDGELCLLQEVFPTRCKTDKEFYDALELAMITASTITLLPTESHETNLVVSRNHRIGVSISGVADWFDTTHASHIITRLREGYRVLRATNTRLAREAGISPSIRVSCIKPSGSVSLLAGVSPGMHYPPFTRYVRRIRIGKDSLVANILDSAGVPNEADVYSANTSVFEFPVESKARRSQRDITIWQKGAMVTMLQRHFADNMVSNTITFDPKTETNQIEDFLAFTLPMNKSISMLPDTEEGAYQQMPYEGITKAEYDRRRVGIHEVDWSRFEGDNKEATSLQFCGNDSCEI